MRSLQVVMLALCATTAVMDQGQHRPYAAAAGTGGASPFALTPGATCEETYEPITNWETCKEATISLGYTDAHVEYDLDWRNTRPEGCFQGTGNRFYFNRGDGGSFVNGDKILCRLQATAELSVGELWE